MSVADNQPIGLLQLQKDPKFDVKRLQRSQEVVKLSEDAPHWISVYEDRGETAKKCEEDGTRRAWEQMSWQMNLRVEKDLSRYAFNGITSLDHLSILSRPLTSDHHRKVKYRGGNRLFKWRWVWIDLLEIVKWQLVVEHAKYLHNSHNISFLINFLTPQNSTRSIIDKKYSTTTSVDCKTSKLSRNTIKNSSLKVLRSRTHQLAGNLTLVGPHEPVMKTNSSHSQTKKKHSVILGKHVGTCCN